jgi:hypothetical protein
MTYPAPAPTPTRPRAVTIAVALLMLTAIALIADAVGLIAGAGQYPGAVREAVERSEVDQRAADALEPFARAISIAAIVLTLIAAAVLALLATLVARGSFAARVVTWVAIGFALLCNVCGLGSAGAGFSGILYVTAYSQDSSGMHTFAQRLPAGYPDWYQPLSLGLAIVCFISLATACVLLALPAAHAYFRKPAPAPVPYPAAYPAAGAWAAPAAPAGPVPPIQPVQPSPATGGWVVPGDPGPISPEQGARLAELNRKLQRGELTHQQYLAEQNHILGRD